MSHGSMDLFSWAPPAEVTERVSVPRKPTDRPSIDERWSAFAKANPHVLAEALRIARSWLDRGDTFISAKAVYEAMRTTIRAEGEGGFKLNNDFTPILSRWLISQEPRLIGVLRLRRRKGES